MHILNTKMRSRIREGKECTISGGEGANLVIILGSE